MSSSSSSSKQTSSFAAFREVDDLVSKPVFGSDGSASWQEFKKTQRRDGPSVAPSLPMKRAAQLGTGFTTLEQERDYENKIRAESGDAILGSGYTSFKRKVDPNELAEKKRVKKVMERIRPDNAIYYIPSITFQGWREDYVFTTRERGVGYYWDGMDSYKKLLSTQNVNEESKDNSSQVAVQTTSNKSIHGKTATNTKAHDGISSISTSTPTSLHNHHSEINSSTAQVATQELVNQVLAAGISSKKTPSTADIDRAILTGSTSLSRIMAKSTGKQWESAQDPVSGREYYFCRSTGESTWEKP